MATFKTLDDIQPAGKRVLVRVDLNVPMANGSALHFHGYFLTHQQSRSKKFVATQDNPFINISAYCNKGVIENCRKSLERVKPK